jgi:hypothetical protein
MSAGEDCGSFVCRIRRHRVIERVFPLAEVSCDLPSGFKSVVTTED